MAVIKIELMSDLCAGNGESVGYGIDNDICKDRYGFPYIPAKRLLGCLKDTAQKLNEYGVKEATRENLDAILGNAYGTEGKLCLENAFLPGATEMHKYIMSLKEDKNPKDYLLRQCTEEKIIRLFSSVRGQTGINRDGKAENGSLRFVRVLNRHDPLTGKTLVFEGKADISELNEEQIVLLEKICKAFRHLGMNRNRGLGNIKATLEKERFASSVEKTKQSLSESKETSEALLYIPYQVEFDSPVTIQEYMEMGGSIKARTMIGVFASAYLKQKKDADNVFRSLFLDGTVKWSALTPVINGVMSKPAPAMLMKLNNDGGRLINAYTIDDNQWKKKKPKSLDGYFAAFHEEEQMYYVAKPETETCYHNRINESEENEQRKAGLYIQESLKQGMTYGGYALVPECMRETVMQLLQNGKIRLGRSKKVQYGATTLRVLEDKIQKWQSNQIENEKEQPVFAILQSDLVVQENACFTVDNRIIRRKIAEITGLKDEMPDGFHDICRYHVLTGYQTMWQMQKPKIRAVMGGSVYCFMAQPGKYASEIMLGEYQQEGLGGISLVTLEQLKQCKGIENGTITEKDTKEVNAIAKNRLEERLLLEAVRDEMREYAFIYMKADQSKDKKEQLISKVPVGRLRQILSDAQNVQQLMSIVNEMKTSDVSSESAGKKKNTEKLLQDFYGLNSNRGNGIDWNLLIQNKELLNFVKNKEQVLEMAKKEWKEPLFILLQMAHYGKGGK